MAKFCTQCGSPIADPANAWCDVCLAAQEVTASYEPTYESRQSYNTSVVQPYLELAQEAFLRPSSAINRAAGFANAIPGLVMAVAGSIVTALAVVLFVRKILDDIFGAIVGFGGYSDIVSFHYGSVFFKLFLLVVLQWVALSLVLTSTSLLFKQRVTTVQSLNIVGVTKLYLAAGAIAAFVLHYLALELAAAVLLAAIVAGYLAIERGIRPLLNRTLNRTSDTFYLVPAAIALYGVCTWILLKIFF